MQEEIWSAIVGYAYFGAAVIVAVVLLAGAWYVRSPWLAAVLAGLGIVIAYTPVRIVIQKLFGV